MSALDVRARYEAFFPFALAFHDRVLEARSLSLGVARRFTGKNRFGGRYDALSLVLFEDAEGKTWIARQDGIIETPDALLSAIRRMKRSDRCKACPDAVDVLAGLGIAVCKREALDLVLSLRSDVGPPEPARVQAALDLLYPGLFRMIDLRLAGHDRAAA